MVWSTHLEHITTIKGKDTKSFLPITYVSRTFVGLQKYWATLRKEAYAIYMTFRKLSHYLYDAKVTIKCDHTLLHKFLTAHTLNPKVNIWEIEISSMSYVIFKHIKFTDIILENSISSLRSLHLYDSLDPEGKGKELGKDIFKELPLYTQMAPCSGRDRVEKV